jgi:GTPase SAR1 family protein
MGNIIRKNKQKKKNKQDNPMEIELIKKHYPVIKSKSFNEFDRRNALIESKSILNIKILGLSGVGKTALINRFVMNRFINNYHSTLNTTSTKEMNLQGDSQ